MDKTLVIIPTYNEKNNIRQIIKLINNTLTTDILIVDDNSPDGTSEIIMELKQDLNNLFLIKRDGKYGLGTAYIEGFTYAIEKEYNYIIQMDADLSHDPQFIPNFLQEMQTQDVVIGSRYLNGISVINWPLRRLLLSCFASKYVRFITGIPIMDPTSGFRCFKREALESIDLKEIKSNGYSFQIEIAYKLWKHGTNIKEIPIIFTERTFGKTKISFSIILEAVFIVFKLLTYKPK
jgi:dolichol-phosphate mannosyltransferase